MLSGSARFNVVKYNKLTIAWTPMGPGLSLEVGELLTENYDGAASVEGLPGISITIHICVPGIGKYNTRLSIIVPIHEHSRPFIQ